VLNRPAAHRPAAKANGSRAIGRAGGSANIRPGAVTASAKSTAAAHSTAAASAETSRRPTCTGRWVTSPKTYATVSTDHSSMRPSGRKLPKPRYIGTERRLSVTSRQGRPCPIEPCQYTLYR